MGVGVVTSIILAQELDLPHQDRLRPQCRTLDYAV